MRTHLGIGFDNDDSGCHIQLASHAEPFPPFGRTQQTPSDPLYRCGWKNHNNNGASRLTSYRQRSRAFGISGPQNHREQRSPY
jgi:hypothetical protein